MNLPLVIANWKMNIPYFDEKDPKEDFEWAMHWKHIQHWFLKFHSTIKDYQWNRGVVDEYLCTPFGIAPPLTSVHTCEENNGSEEVSPSSYINVSIGFQDVSSHRSGARTGEMSASMLAGYLLRDNYSFCIIGHSERREFQKETDEVISEKLKRLLETDIVPVVCIGETLKDFEKGLTKEVLKNQIDVIFNSLESDKNIIIAYEPVWAIGSGKPAVPTDVNEIHKFIKDTVQSCAKITDINVLYGGSVNAENSKSFFEQKFIDGALVGGASLDPVEFGKICINYIHQMETQE